MASSSAGPAGKLNATVTVWPADQILFRVHNSIYPAHAFNPSRLGDARFSPLIDKSGTVIPTLYAGSTLDCALMETVFHVVPFALGLKTLSKVKHIKGQVYSRLRPVHDLALIDLTSIPLRKLGIRRSNLIDTPASRYPITRKWALALNDQCPRAHGLLWTSRQDDTGSAMVLFANRLASSALEIVDGPTSLTSDDGSALTEVIALADRLGVLLV
jgi:hypothetical protein